MLEFILHALRTDPEIAALPPAAQWAFSEFGLTAFGAVVCWQGRRRLPR